MTGRRVIGGIGVAAIAFGGLQVLLNLEAASPFGLAAFLVAVVILDDLVLMPLALAAGWLVGRAVPPAARSSVRVALIVFAGLLLVGLPFALSPSRDGESGTLLTEPYMRNLAVLATIIATGLALDLVRRRARRGRSRGATANGTTASPD